MFSMNECESKIIEYCLSHSSLSPIALAREIMERDIVRLHGPEHHFLTAAVLSTAWYYSRSQSPAEHLEKLRQRCAKIPPAVCGYYGVCGDTLGAGAFLSEALEASYLSKESWATVNRFTARVQAGIGAAGETGPRCCKRTTFAAIAAAISALDELLGLNLPGEEEIYCGFFGKNSQCIGKDCAFFPRRKGQKHEQDRNCL